ncbi:MAG: fatty acid desaturase [Bdellovibrionota bacterium]
MAYDTNKNHQDSRTCENALSNVKSNIFNPDLTQRTKWVAFAEEVDEIGRNIKRSTGAKDFAHLKKMERWGRLASFIGYATAWIIPNPISALLISQGNYTRWALIFHTVSHGALDRVPNIPARYTSKGFAKGGRRFLDWFDWITPQSWHDEHNKMHHCFLGTESDPDVVVRNTAFLRENNIPMALRYVLSAVIACIWKPFYYAPNTLAESRFRRGLSKTNKLGSHTWSPFTAEGKELWLSCMLPYALTRFVVLPAMFLPLGKTAALCVLINSVLAEIFTNLYSFATIAPNHTGDDVYTFTNLAKGRADFYLRQIVGTINFPAGNDVVDFFYGGMNYQIEHHLWPEASLYQCKRARPLLKQLCAKYEIPYQEFPILPRVLKTIKLMTGAAAPLEVTLVQKTLKRSAV